MDARIIERITNYNIQLKLKKILTAALLLALSVSAAEARENYSLDEGWHSVCYPEGKADTLEAWKLQLPHNWDDYYGYRQYTHGNLHGTARYDRKFSLMDLDKNVSEESAKNKLYMLHLEGVGSYVTVRVNGHEVCTHRPAGRVVTSLDISEALHTRNIRQKNEIEIICEHPSNITDMPWVCGGCSSEWGFSEGSAPLGLFRGVSLEVSEMLRVEPFGVHAWANDALDTIWVETEVRNYTTHGENCVVQSMIAGKLKKETIRLGARLTRRIRQALPVQGLGIKPWDLDDPQLYKVSTTLMRGAQHEVADRVETEVGFSVVKWPNRTVDGKLDDQDHRFYLNGKPVYLHGVCEYEHLFGQSHALSDEEIDYRCQLIKHMGFNVVRDAHQPHNLRYGDNWAHMGILWWPQFSAHIWYDTPQFRQNFKTLLRQWVKERRNNPAIILWGLQNESTLPEDFARECSDILREMDPKTSQLAMGEVQVPATAAALGSDVSAASAEDKPAVKKASGSGRKKAVRRRSRRRGSRLSAVAPAPRKQKVRRRRRRRSSSSARQEVVTQQPQVQQTPEQSVALQSQASSQQNQQYVTMIMPTHRKSSGRLITTCNGGTGTDWNVVQNWSGTYGGNLAAYGEELAKDDQLLNGEYGGWRTVGLHDGQSSLPVSLFDSKAAWSEDHFCALMHAKLTLAWQNREQLCGQFQWILASHDNPGRQQPDEFLRVIDKVGPLNYKGLLTAMWEPTDAYYLYVAWGAYMRGDWPAQTAAPTELTAREVIKLGYRYENVPLPDYLLTDAATEACSRPELHRFNAKTDLLAPDKDRVYLYRYNCGGDEVTDSYGNVWMGDDTRYCYNWSMAPQFAADSLCPVLASQAMVNGWALATEPGPDERLAAMVDQPLLRSYRYGRHELQFSFPLPAGSIYRVDLWFVNRKHQVKHVDYLTRSVVGGQLIVGFPGTKVGQSKVSAIAISLDKKRAKEFGSLDKRGQFVFKPNLLDDEHPAVAQKQGYPYSAGLTWAELDKQIVEKTDKATLPADKGGRPSAKFDVEPGQAAGRAAFAIQMGLAQEYALRFRYKNPDGPALRSHWQLLAQQDGRIVAEGDLTLPQTPNKMKMVSTTTGTFVNAGHYQLVVTGANGAEFESVEVQ